MKEIAAYSPYHWSYFSESVDRIDSVPCYFAGEQAGLGNSSSPEARLVQRQVVARVCMHLVLQNTP